jgi:predicted NACHT family NTPase
MSDFDFQPYRNFVLRQYGEHRTLYTPTDVMLPLQVGVMAKQQKRLERKQELVNASIPRQKDSQEEKKEDVIKIESDRELKKEDVLNLGGNQEPIKENLIVKEERLPVLEGLRKYALGKEGGHVLLSGKPGSGKSTALYQLLLALAEEGLVPVLLQLKGNQSILEGIANELENGDLELEPKEIKRLLRNQKLVLLLDGVN